MIKDTVLELFTIVILKHSRLKAVQLVKLLVLMVPLALPPHKKHQTLKLADTLYQQQMVL
jgi:hypothetical protein